MLSNQELALNLPDPHPLNLVIKPLFIAIYINGKTTNKKLFENLGAQKLLILVEKSSFSPFFTAYTKPMLSIDLFVNSS